MEKNQGELSLRLLQDGVRTWTRQNFGKPEDRSSHHPLLGVSEETGELCHAHLKWEQGIRGTPEELEEKAKDAVGDILIYLADYCNLRGFDMQEIVEETWAGVSQRNWKKNTADGKVVKTGRNPEPSVDPYSLPDDDAWNPSDCKQHDECWCQACDCEVTEDDQEQRQDQGNSNESP